MGAQQKKLWSRWPEAGPLDGIPIRFMGGVVHDHRQFTYDPGWWPKFLEKWYASSTDESDRQNMLYEGFRGPATFEETVARVMFYMDVADGYGISLPCIEGEPQLLTAGGVVTRREMRRQVRVKAMVMLCQHLFKEGGSISNRERYFELEHGKPTWVRILRHQPFLERVLRFFRLENGKIRNLDNFECGSIGKHNLELLQAVVRDIARAAWREDHLDHLHHANEKKFLRESRGILAELFFGLDLVDFILYDDTVRWRPIDPALVDKLERLELELQEVNLPDGTHGYPTTLEDAIFAGSRRAGTIKLLRIYQAGLARAAEIRAAQERLAEAESVLASATQERTS